MLIGELAQRSGVSPKTLRFYEHAGVLAEPGRTSGGYRDYDEGALDRLAFIRSAQSAGLTLAEIRGVIAIREGGVAPCTHVTELIEEKARSVARRIAELRALQHELEQLRAHAATVDPADCDPRMVCQVLAPKARGRSSPS